MTNTDRFRSGFAGALIALMLATPVAAASDGHQMLLDKRAAEVAATGEIQTEEELERQNRVGSGIVAGTGLGIDVGLGLVFLLLLATASPTPG